MVLSALSSTYQLYKADTDSLAAWLASTARSLGFYNDTSSAAAASTKSKSKKGAGGRPKGKARAEAKKQAATLKKPPAGPTYIINIKDFVPLAEYVATKAPNVPGTLMATIERVITARSGFGAKLEKHGKVLSELSDVKHQYFIQILEKVHDVLLPFVKAEDIKQNASTDEKLSNRFAGLDIYEPSQEFLDAPDIERPTKTQDDNAVYEAEPDTSFEQAIFALTTVTNDMKSVRARIRNIWSHYKTGIIDVAAASIATNTAIDLVRNMMEDILPLLNKHGGIRVMLRKFHIVQSLLEGFDLEDIEVGGGMGEMDFDTYDVNDVTYCSTFRLVEAFADVIEPDVIPLYKEGMYGYYNPAIDRSRKTGWEKFKDDRALLMPFFTELMTAIRGARDWPVKDEFCRGMEELSKTKQVPFYLVFAAQVFLDVTYELGNDIGRPFTTMVAQTTTMDNDITQHFEFHANLKINHWPANNDRYMLDLQRSIQWVRKDPLRFVQDKLRRRLGVELEDNVESHRIFRMSPVASGLMLYHFRTRYREIGLGVADAWGSIQYCQHLYNALSREGLLHGRWRDMEIIATNLGEDSFYVGGELPGTFQDYFKKFCLQMGTSAAAMTKGRRKNTPLESKAGPRGLKAASPVLSMFKARYVDNSGQVDFTPEHVSQIIELSLFEPVETEEGGRFLIGQIEDPKKLAEKKRLQQAIREGRGKMAKSGTMPAELLIGPLVQALHAETFEYVYPYLNMHRWCWRLLRSVKDMCDPLLREIYTPAYIEKEYQLPWVVGWIFMAASGLEGVSDRRPLQLAADAMNIFLHTGMSEFIVRKVLGDAFGMPCEFQYDGDDSEEEDDED